MKNLLTILFALIISAPYVLSQTFECNRTDEASETIVITNIVCMDNGTPNDPDDDYFSFMVNI